MTECFVDLTYRGLALGKRVKLTEVTPDSGYLELPAPMPVGTSISILTDDGLAFEASVTRVHEQVAGASVAPGMKISPSLTDDAAAAWWGARVSVSSSPATGDAEIVISRRPTVTVRPRPHTIQTPPPAWTAQGNEPTGEATSPGEADASVLAVATTGDHPVVDDGRRTTVMEAVDVSALDLSSSSPGMTAGDPDDDDGGTPPPDPGRTAPGMGKKKKKRR